MARSLDSRPVAYPTHGRAVQARASCHADELKRHFGAGLLVVWEQQASRGIPRVVGLMSGTIRPAQTGRA